MKAALPHLLQARGAVVAVSSVAALRASEAMAAYSAIKGLFADRGVEVVGASLPG